jgi:uncharacterized protein
MIPPQQAETASLLRRLSGGAEPVETHISAVFVGPETAFKLKKAVALGFLDFTDPASRERFARRELALNAAYAPPGLYRDVVPVVRGPDGALALGGAGEAVDWVLRMAPLPPGAFLDRVAAEAGLAPTLLDQAADAVWAMHAGAAPVLAQDAPAAMAAVIAGNASAARAARLPVARVDAWEAGAEGWRARLAPLLAARAAEGRVRRCHGDLHLGNLCLWEGRPTPFDALEFDEALATTDTGYDLAFLLMDLERRVSRAAANRVMNRYVARGGDAGLTAALPLWLSLRAVIRAHVEGARGKPEPALGYLAMAEGYLRPPPGPGRIVAIGGLQGTGKSTLARALAPGLGAAPGALVLRSDEIRKRLHGRAPEEALPPEGYSPAASAAVFQALFAQAAGVAGGGHDAIADASFLAAEDRAGIAAAAAASGAPFTGIWLTAPAEVLRARVAGRRADASDADLAVLEAALAKDPGPPPGWIVLDASRDPVQEARDALRVAREGTC